jgi:hypothetical protein
MMLGVLRQPVPRNMGVRYTNYTTRGTTLAPGKGIRIIRILPESFWKVVSNDGKLPDRPGHRGDDIRDVPETTPSQREGP